MKKVVLGLVVGALCSVASAGLAQTKEKVFKDWTVYTTVLQGKKTCYIASYPKSKTGNYSRRDEPYFLVTRRSGDVSEVSSSAGYKFKANSDVKVDIDGNKFNMFTKGELSWAQDVDADKNIISAMKKGSNMTVRGTSWKGTYSVDKYSLNGITAAFDHMNSLCES